MQNVIATLAVAMQAGQSGLPTMVMIVAMIAIFYVVLFLPQQRRQKKWQAMLSQLKTGDKVITSGGLRGIVIALRDDFIHLRVPPDNLRLEVARSAVVSVTTGEEAITTAK